MKRVTILAACAVLSSPLAAQGQNPEKQFGGPDGVQRQLEPQYTVDTLHTVAEPYFEWKQDLYASTGLKFGFWASALWAEASDVAAGSSSAFGSILRFQGSWDIVDRGGKSPGSLNFRVEHRTAIGGNIDPGRLSGNLGMGALNTGFPYSDNFDTDLAVLSWKQIVGDNWGFDIGRLAFDVYQDPLFVQSTSGGFLNRSFVLNPTMGATGIGALGAVVKGFVGDHLWLGGQLYDANASNGDFDTDTISEGEFLKSVEIGYTPSRSRSRTDRVQLTLWHKDERQLAGAAEGSGVAVSTSWNFDKLTPFARLGSSDGGGGAPAEAALSFGLEYKPTFDQSLSIGWGWADLSDDTYGAAADDETVLEGSWRWQVSPNFQLMPDIQFVQNPVNNPGSDSEMVLSIRAILTF